jgi:sporulation protein YlmC with PRC-barrel domain
VTSAKDILNKTVITRDARILGKLGSPLVDDAWKVPRLSILLSRDVADRMEIRKPFFGSPRVYVEPSEVSSLTDNLVLTRRLDEMSDHFKERGAGMEAQVILGRKVQGEEEYAFGDTEDLDIDKAHWRVSDVLVDVRRKAADDMGYPMTIFGSCKAKVPVRIVEEVKDALQLSVGPDDFKNYIVRTRSRD